MHSISELKSGMYILYAFSAGLIGTTLYAILGAITTRKFNYPLTYLLPIQFGLYTLVGYVGSNGSHLNTALICTILVSVYDATIGWDLWMKFNPDLSKDENVSKSTLQNRLILMIVFAIVFGFIGYALA